MQNSVNNSRAWSSAIGTLAPPLATALGKYEETEPVCSLKRSQSCATTLKARGSTSLTSGFPLIVEFKIPRGLTLCRRLPILKANQSSSIFTWKPTETSPKMSHLAILMRGHPRGVHLLPFSVGEL